MSKNLHTHCAQGGKKEKSPSEMKGKKKPLKRQKGVAKGLGETCLFSSGFKPLLYQKRARSSSHERTLEREDFKQKKKRSISFLTQRQ